MATILRNAIMSLLTLTFVTGIAYPLLVTGLAQLLFAHAANGSLIERGNKPLGSELIGQPFSDPKYFWSRPSATSPFADNSASSTGSNLGPTNPALADAVKQRIEALRAADPGNTSAGADRSRHCVRQRPRPGYFAGRRGISGCARRARSRPLHAGSRETRR